MGEPEWATDSAYDTAEGRFAAQDELEAHISDWTSKQSKMDVTAACQMMGLPAAPMLTTIEQLADPHFQARGYPRWIDQQDLGWICFEGPAFQASGMSDVHIDSAPLLGQHTREICRRDLGLSDAEIEKLVAAGTLEVPREG